MTTQGTKAHFSTPTITFSQFYKKAKLYEKEMCWSRKFSGVVATMHKPMAMTCPREFLMYPLER
jgi:hypothetical protein